ncbi:MAG: VOC family protein [Deltaproteobacteria bacterium]|nr:VOC family protein [Deltaproteobacteria bacterium]MBI3387436.1 VOC family protein [Deltaproteobacteria bacterium]
MQLDSAHIGVDDLDRAAAHYALLLGSAPVTTAGGTRRFQLERGAVELEVGAPGVHAIRFVPAAMSTPTWPVDVDAFNGLDVRIGAMTSPSITTVSANAVHAIDHVVINTPDLDRAIALWRDRLGVRLALDREFPSRALRICFFRSADITLEFVSSLPPPPDRSGPDRFFGIAYQVADLAGCRDRLLQAGIDVSHVRPGQKSGTEVATVRSHTSGVPTLLIAPVSSRSV